VAALGLSVKKVTRAAEQDRPDFAAGRQQWQADVALSLVRLAAAGVAAILVHRGRFPRIPEWIGILAVLLALPEAWSRARCWWPS
jgi:hypothetical protein